MDKRAFLENWFDRVWHQEDLSAIDELMTKDAPVEGMYRTPRIGADDFKSFAAALLTQIAEVRVTIERFMEDGDEAVILIHVKARDRATGAAVETSGMALARIEKEKITAAYNFIDFMSLFEQLNILPEETLGRCLSQQALHA